ncbi:hypothetical protein BGW38_004194 [Lunasporangiospora selenospora]|uniref:Phytanoyl-CoA dioxygenase (PhyH) n=1 Tax=Lunasporangiospora selenospora TaxID=979761 RepID=A0A9P6KC68_9FUNG|nr:hypothetical protein BGW38_004194 [Lunasporangiospora selenospora]
MDPSAREANSVVSCWTALDNVNLSNGTLIIEPFPRLVDATTEKVLELPATEALDDPEYFLRYHRAISSRYLTELDPATAVEQARRNHVRSDCANPAPSKSKREGALTPDDLMTIIETCPIERQTPILVEIPAGSVVFLSGFVRHCSLGNSTSLFRRAFMPQYSAGKVETSEGGLVSLAVPCEE